MTDRKIPGKEKGDVIVGRPDSDEQYHEFAYHDDEDGRDEWYVRTVTYPPGASAPRDDEMNGPYTRDEMKEDFSKLWAEVRGA